MVGEGKGGKGEGKGRERDQGELAQNGRAKEQEQEQRSLGETHAKGLAQVARLKVGVKGGKDVLAGSGGSHFGIVDVVDKLWLSAGAELATFVQGREVVQQKAPGAAWRGGRSGKGMDQQAT